MKFTNLFLDIYLAAGLQTNSFKVRLPKLGINHIDVIGITLVLEAEGNML